ncbi:MAG: hypothetical protein AAF950_00140 [Pseudomonadota bacterium]
MCLPIADKTMLGWLHSQLKVLDAWQAELVRRGEADIETLERLERHHAWLDSEIARLEAEETVAA